MKMHFLRNDSGETTVQLVEDGNMLPFNYTTLVKHLIANAKLEETTFDGEFSTEERASVNSMVELLVQACSEESSGEQVADGTPFDFENKDAPF